MCDQQCLICESAFFYPHVTPSNTCKRKVLAIRASYLSVVLFVSPAAQFVLVFTSLESPRAVCHIRESPAGLLERGGTSETPTPRGNWLYAVP